MNRHHAIAAVFGFACLTFAVRDASAQKVYKWTDKDGKVHFSNVAPSNEAAPDDTSGVKGIEAQNPPAAPPPEAAAPPEVPPVASEEMATAPREPAAAAGSDQSAISDEGFSARATATRQRLKREMSAAKTEWTEASDKLAALKKERDEPVRVGLEMLQKAYGPDSHASSDEDDLRKRKEKAERRMDDIRKQYADLHDEAVKRYGHSPGWWLPIE